MLQHMLAISVLVPSSAVNSSLEESAGCPDAWPPAAAVGAEGPSVAGASMTILFNLGATMVAHVGSCGELHVPKSKRYCADGLCPM